MTYERLGSRSVASEVVFKHPFTFGRDARELPAGVYAVHTHQDVHQGAFNPVYVSISVELVVADGGRAVSRFADPAEMRLALAKDENRTLLEDGANENPDRLAT